CSAEVRIGQLSAKGLIPVLLPVANPENVFGVPVTMVDFRGVGIGHPGDTAQVRIRCQFVDAAGVRQRHGTLWAPTLEKLIPTSEEFSRAERRASPLRSARCFRSARLPAGAVGVWGHVMWERTNSWAVRVHANCRRKRSTGYAMARLSS